MMWLITIWVISIILNTVMIIRSMRIDRARVTGLYLFYYTVFGTIVAPIVAFFILIGLVIVLHQRLKKVDILNKTIYRFGGKKDE